MSTSTNELETSEVYVTVGVCIFGIKDGDLKVLLKKEASRTARNIGHSPEHS